MTARQSLADVVADPRPVVDWIARTYAAPTAVGATFLVGRLAHATASGTLPLLVAGAPVPSLASSEVSFGWTDEARVVDMSFTGPATTASLGSELLAAFEPLVHAVRRTAAVGRSGLWGMVADGVGAAACALERAGLTAADEVLEELARRCSTRPRWIPVVGQGREHLFQARGSCCLAFRIDGHGYCTSCPSVPEAERLARLRTWVDANS